MNANTEKIDEIDFSIGQKWMNTENGNEFYITNIDHSLITLDDKKGKLSSFNHMNNTLWNHLVKVGFYKKIL